MSLPFLFLMNRQRDTYFVYLFLLKEYPFYIIPFEITANSTHK